MLSRVEGGGGGRKEGGGGGDSAGKLLNDIQTISKALYLDKPLPKASTSGSGNPSRSTGKKTHLPPDPKSRPRYGSEDLSQKDKKSSIWNWKPLKAFSNTRNRKFTCCFSVQVHSIEGLPSRFENASFCVHWKRRDGELVTRLSKVLDGVAEFEERLTHECAVYGTRSGPHHSAKYEAKHFLLFASVLGATELDLGKHRVDLTRLLPLTLEELEDEKSSGKWTTSFKLSGEGKGATMNVSFGYIVVNDSVVSSGNRQTRDDMLSTKQNNLKPVKPASKFGQASNKSMIRRAESLPGGFGQLRRSSSQSVEDVRDLHEVLPVSRSELVIKVDVMHPRFNEDVLDDLASHKHEAGVSSEHVAPVEFHPHPSSDHDLKGTQNESEDGEFSITEKGIILPSNELDTGEVDKPPLSRTRCHGHFTGTGFSWNRKALQPFDLQAVSEESSMIQRQDVGDSGAALHSTVEETFSKESVMKELESALSNFSNLEVEGCDSLEDSESCGTVRTNFDNVRDGTLLSYDDDIESVANDFLDMLGIGDSPFGLTSGSDPESPREQLLRQFEEDAHAGGFSLFDSEPNDIYQGDLGFDDMDMHESPDSCEDLDLASMIEAVEEEYQMGAQAESSKTRAKALEDLESAALMREWGLNDTAFQYSPPKGGFGSPIDANIEEPLELPPLGEGLGPFMKTKNGGFLRSMSPVQFQNAKSGGNLVMQVSSPVVVPAEMGSDVMGILQGLASVGIERLSMQANKLMPLEDITGKTMQQVAWEAGMAIEGGYGSESSSQHDMEIRHDVSSGPKRMKGRSSVSSSNKSHSLSAGDGSEYVSLEELAPLAMDKIEALSMEGLRIQSGMSDEDAPSNISAKSIGELSALHGKDGVNVSGSLGMEGTAGLQLLDIKDSGDEVDGLMGLSLTLDEWMRLDSGDIGDEDHISERTSKILVAHHASSLDSVRGGSRGDRKRGKGSGRKCGLLGNNFTVALLVQLRDPLRNYESVGTPMLALVQVERVFVPPKPKIFRKVSEWRKNDEEDDESEPKEKEKANEERIDEKGLQQEAVPQFQINEVLVAGLPNEPGKKKLWGTATQQQSGSRWLLANGMGKTNNKNPFMKSKAGFKSANAMSGDSMWSVSSRGQGSGSKWKDPARSGPHVRNPNVLVPKGNMSLR